MPGGIKSVDHEFYRGSITRAFSQALSEYDESTADHSERVGGLASRLAAELDLDYPDRLLVTHAGLIHDLGKLGVKPAILVKAGPLTSDEWVEVQRHSAIGAEVLLDISPELAPMAEGVRAHHERWDGTGYPDGLAGEQIPVFGRLLAVVDVYDALTSPRAYRRSAFSPGEAMTYLEGHAGTQFDPTCVAAVLDVLRSQNRSRGPR